jgi:hypothetical protein
MKFKKDIAILFFVITVLIFYIYSEKKNKTHYELPEIQQLHTADISRLEIKKEGLTISLLKEEGKWLVDENKYPADHAMVENMLNRLSELTLTALASESENYSLYSLDEKSRIEVHAYKDESLLRKISIGKPASSYRHTFVMIDDDPRVFHADGNIKNDFDKKTSGLRDKKVMSFNDDIMEIVLTKDSREMTIVKAAAPVSVETTEEEIKNDDQPKQQADPKWTTADGGAVNQKEVNEIISTLSGLSCDNFIEDRTKDDFQTPVFRAVLKGVNTYTVAVFEKQENQYPAISSESNYPFLISDWKAQKIMKNFATLTE